MSIKFKNPFSEEPSLEELQAREERVSTQLSISQKEALIKRVEAEGRKWEDFSNNGRKSGIRYEKIMAWLRGTKGGAKRRTQ